MAGFITSRTLSKDGLYVIGHDRVSWVDRFGSLVFTAVLLGVTVHAGIRLYYS